SAYGNVLAVFDLGVACPRVVFLFRQRGCCNDRGQHHRGSSRRPVKRHAFLPKGGAIIPAALLLVRTLARWAERRKGFGSRSRRPECHRTKFPGAASDLNP